MMPTAWDDMILVGRIARAHGLRGQVIVTPETDFVEARFAAGATLWTRSAAGEEMLVVASSRLQNRRPVIALEGFDTIDAAERIVGQELRVPPEMLAPLDANTYYHHDLIGCVVETVDGERIGEVTAVQGAGGSLLVVNGARGEVLVPLALDICVGVDVQAKRIRIQPPEGLLDANDTRASRKSRT